MQFLFHLKIAETLIFTDLTSIHTINSRNHYYQPSKPPGAFTPARDILGRFLRESNILFHLFDQSTHIFLASFF